MMSKHEDAYKPAITFTALAGICIALAVGFKIWPLYGFATFCGLVTIVIMLEKVAERLR